MDLQPSNQMNQSHESLNHGGHEVFDVHEVLAGTISILDQYMMFHSYVQDQELKRILNRQYHYLLNAYNLLVEAFSTPRTTAPPTMYQAQPSTEPIIYGIIPSQPKKPNQSLNDMNDQGISGYMLGLVKSAASLLTMSAMEVTNPVVRRLMGGLTPSYVEMAYELFLYQNKRHYYQVPQLAASDMTTMTSSFSPLHNQPQMPDPTQGQSIH